MYFLIYGQSSLHEVRNPHELMKMQKQENNLYLNKVFRASICDNNEALQPQPAYPTNDKRYKY
jgi:hypothetical protein